MGSEANAVQLGNGEVKLVKLEESGVIEGSEANAVQLGNGEVKPVKLEESGATVESEANAVQLGNGEVKVVKSEESGVTMGSEANAVQLDNGEVKAVKLEDCDKNIEADGVKHSLPPVMPASPDARGEGINVSSNFTSPSSVRTSPPELACVDAHQKCQAPGSPDASDPITPKGGSFDPFAPGSGKLVMAPRGSKYSRESREAKSRSARSIKFDFSVRLAIEEYCESDEENALEDESLLQFLFKDLLGVIVSTQVYSVQHDTCQDEVLVMLDGYQTPEPSLTGIADTCPPAPVKIERKAMIIDSGLCRKLEF